MQEIVENHKSTDEPYSSIGPRWAEMLSDISLVEKLFTTRN
jgi:hypothetical protein